jgi:uncharacterized protein with FMN-binding domain
MLKEDAVRGERYVLVAAILVAALAATQACTTRSDRGQARAYPGIDSIDFHAVRDGQYEGFYDYYGMANARVRVTVSGGRMTAIRLLKHFHFPFLSGAKVTRRIAEQQSPEVDVVSGATGSSLVVKKAVELALRQGL